MNGYAAGVPPQGGRGLFRNPVLGFMELTDRKERW